MQVNAQPTAGYEERDWLKPLGDIKKDLCESAHGRTTWPTNGSPMDGWQLGKFCLLLCSYSHNAINMTDADSEMYPENKMCPTIYHADPSMSVSVKAKKIIKYFSYRASLCDVHNSKID